MPDSTCLTTAYLCQTDKYILDKMLGADGLVHLTDDTCFDGLCDELIEYREKFSSKFVQYFNMRFQQNIRSKVNLPMKEGIISRDWTNNNPESINHVLKHTVNWETESLPEFVRLTKRVVDGQYQKLRSALLSSG